MKNYKEFIEKIIYSQAPLIWGLFAWFMMWGPGWELFNYGKLSSLIRVVAALAAIIFFFGKTLDKASHNQIYFFGKPLFIPSWRLFAVLVLLAAGINLTPLVNHEFIQSLVSGVIISAILEEFITRTLFIKFRMGIWQFIFFNIVSSCSFTLMHSFYTQEGITLFAVTG